MAKPMILGLTGDKRLIAKLGDFSAADQRRIIRRPVAAAMVPINKAAKRNAPKDRKYLSKAIGVKVKAYKGATWGGVGIRTGDRYSYVDEEGNVHKPANYGPLVELGTRFSRAEPYLRPAFDENRAKSVKILETQTWKHIEARATRP